MCSEERSSIGVLDEFIDKAMFTNYIPLLIRAIAENDEPTAGYMLNEIEKITFQQKQICYQLGDYLNRKLEKPSAYVKLKVLKIMTHLIKYGHLNYRCYLRINYGSIKTASMYSGPPDPLLGLTPYENVRELAHVTLNTLFNPDLVQQDETVEGISHSNEKEKLQLGGLGASGNSKGKYEGFGNSPINKEDTLKNKMIDMLDKVLNPTDETAEKIKSALTMSPGNYEAVPVEVPLISHSSEQQQRNVAIKMRVHVPGRAGGGWESDEDTQLETSEFQSNSGGSIVSVDSLEKIDTSVGEITPAGEAVHEFCEVQDWPVSTFKLNEACKKCTALNCIDAIQAIGNILLQPSDRVSNTTIIRALLMLEWFIRTDLVTPTSVLQIVLLPFSQLLKSESADRNIRIKTEKIKLILDKL